MGDNDLITVKASENIQGRPFCGHLRRVYWIKPLFERASNTLIN